MGKAIVGIAVVVLAIATFFDLKKKGLGYKLLPKSVQQLSDKIVGNESHHKGKE